MISVTRSNYATLQRQYYSCQAPSASRCNGLKEYNTIHQTDFATIARCLNMNGPVKILDAACGKGRFLAELDRTLVNISPFGIDLFNDPERNGVGNFLLGRLDSIPFRNDLFDLVVSTSSLAFVFDPLRAVEEIHRVLKPGGRAFVHMPITLFSSPDEPLDILPAINMLKREGFGLFSVYEQSPVTLLRMTKNKDFPSFRLPFILSGIDDMIRHYKIS